MRRKPTTQRKELLMIVQKVPTFDEIKHVDKKLGDMRHEYWLHETLFSWEWFFLIALIVVPWIIWCFVVNKRRIHEILLYGMIVILISITLDDLGVEMDLWSYPYLLAGIFPRMNPVDLAVMPVTYMIIYQYFSHWKSFIIAHIVLAAVASFVIEPLFHWMGIYILNKWTYLCSFPIYIFIGITTRAFMIWLNRREKPTL
jgi:hypothetical protein